MDRIKTFLNAALGEFLWAVILVPILAISWVGFYTIARDIGIPPVFAAGMSAAFDGIALFAARIGLKHRRKGFSGYLARITVIAFAALGAFVQSFHGETQGWIHAHSWIVWATAPIAACLAYELHLGWVHRKQLIRNGYVHPSAKSGFGPATWFNFPRETLHEYREVLRARRAYIATTNLQRFELEEASQPQLETVQAVSAAPPAQSAPSAPSVPSTPSTPNVPAVNSVPKPSASKKPRPKKPSASKTQLHSVPSSRPPTKPAAGTRRPKTRDQVIRQWAREHGRELGHNGRIPIDVLRDYRAEVAS